MFTPSDPAGVTDTGAWRMFGLGSTVTFTPLSTSVKVDVRFRPPGTNCQYGLRYGSGSAPANGAAAAGTSIERRSVTLNGGGDRRLFGYATGLTPGTAYWFDMECISMDGGSGVSQEARMSIEEL
jgi:hypothetical protein